MSSAPDEAEVAGAAQKTLVAVGALIEAPVRNRAGKPIGKVAEIMLEGGKGTIAYAVVACGGVLGIGETLHAVNWCDFTVDPFDGHLTLDLDELDAASAFDKDHWPISV